MKKQMKNEQAPAPQWCNYLQELMKNLPGTFDAHTHSVVSDGQETLDELCRAARCAGVSHLAVTDHDWPLSCKEARELSLRHSLDVIPGVELNTSHTVNGKKVCVHLGMMWLPEDRGKELERVLAHNQSLPREAYVKAMLEKLCRLGIDPVGGGVDRSYEAIVERNPHSHYLGKGAVSQLLVDTGIVGSRAEAGDRFLSGHGERLAFVPAEEFFDFADMAWALEAIQKLNRDRDTAVLVTLNHPYYYGLEDAEMETLVRDFSKLGGHSLELFYPRHDEGRLKRVQGLCERYGLLPNGGSDRHHAGHPFLKGDPALFDALLDFHYKKPAKKAPVL